MENAELFSLWKAQNVKLEQSLAINQFLLKEAIGQRAKSSLNSLKTLMTTGIIAFVIYLVLLGLALAYAFSNYSSAANYFIISVSAIALINLKGFADYIKHLFWASNINYDGSVIEIQQQLSRLQLSILDHSKWMCLQFPFFTTFFLSDVWFPQDVGVGYIIFQILLTGSFTYFSYWLYRFHKPENLEKKWFRTLIAGSGGASVLKAMKFYEEMEEFKKD